MVGDDRGCRRLTRSRPVAFSHELGIKSNESEINECRSATTTVIAAAAVGRLTTAAAPSFAASSVWYVVRAERAVVDGGTPPARPPARSCDTLQSEANGVAVVGHLGISNGRTMDGRTDGRVDELVVGWHCRRWKASSLDPATTIPFPPVYDALQSLTVKLLTN